MICVGEARTRSSPPMTIASTLMNSRLRSSARWSTRLITDGSASGAGAGGGRLTGPGNDDRDGAPADAPRRRPEARGRHSSQSDPGRRSGGAAADQAFSSTGSTGVPARRSRARGRGRLHRARSRRRGSGRGSVAALGGDARAVLDVRRGLPELPDRLAECRPDLRQLARARISRAITRMMINSTGPIFGSPMRSSASRFVPCSVPGHPSTCRIPAHRRAAAAMAAPGSAAPSAALAIARETLTSR